MVHDNDIIRLLDAGVIHQLRSSLVISTFTQCLKELICNSIDAESTQIDIMIDVENFSLQVNDNGNGIQNMSKIGQRHVTSKCHTLSDMSQLKTFGFRGEALAAIINEAHVHVISRHKLSLETYEGIWKNGRVISRSKHTRKNQPGTSVIVRDLFYKFPVRRRHLSSSIDNPYQHVVMIESVKRLIINFSLCFHHITFTLVDSARNTKILNIKKSSNSIEVFRQLFGQELSKYTKWIDLHEDNIKVNGFFSTSGYPNKTHQYIYVNNFLIPSNSRLYTEVSTLFNSSNFSGSILSDTTSISKNGARVSIQKYPMFLIKFECTDWSYYEVNMYLEILTVFPSFVQILSLLKKFTFKFLEHSGLVDTTTEPLEKRNSINKKRPRQQSFAHHTKVSPYLTHSSASSSIFASNSSANQSTYSDCTGINEKESSKYVTWWDPNSKRTFIIDRITGNSQLSTPTSRISHTQNNSVDRSHLKKIKSNNHSIFGNQSNTRKIYENSNHTTSRVRHTPHKLSKIDLQNSTVLGQVDDKYIAIKRKIDHSNNLIIMIDQHAADERVKLEKMLQPSSIASKILDPTICLILESQHDYHIITDSRTLKYLRIWGIHISTTFGTLDNGSSSVSNVNNNRTTKNMPSVDACMTQPHSPYPVRVVSDESPHFSKKKDTHRLNSTPEKLQQRKHLNKVYVTQLPNIIVERCVLNHSLLRNLIKEYAYWLTEQREETIIHKTCPKGIMEILKSKACRSAIMFNDKLTLIECKRLVDQLSKCNYPFQCAHGRPTAIPIKLDSNSMNRPKRDIDWSRLQV